MAEDQRGGNLRHTPLARAEGAKLQVWSHYVPVPATPPAGSLCSLPCVSLCLSVSVWAVRAPTVLETAECDCVCAQRVLHPAKGFVRQGLSLCLSVFLSLCLCLSCLCLCLSVSVSVLSLSKVSFGKVYALLLDWPEDDKLELTLPDVTGMPAARSTSLGRRLSDATRATTKS